MNPFTPVRQQIRAAQLRFGRAPEAVRGFNVGYHRRTELRLPSLVLPAGGDPDIDGRRETFASFRNAAASSADLLYFDLCDLGPDGTTDAGHPELGPLAVRLVVDALRDLAFGERVMGIRLPPLRSTLFDEAVIHSLDKVGDEIDVFMLTDIESADEVREVLNIIRNAQRVAGRKNPISVEVEIGTARAALAAEAIVALDEVSALVFEPRGLARGLAVHPDANTWIWDFHAVRGQLPVIAAAHGKEAVDGLSVHVLRGDATDEVLESSLDLLHAEAGAAVRHGFAAKRVASLHHVAVVNAAFTLDRDAALTALGVAVAFARSAPSPLAGGRDFAKAHAAVRAVRIAMLAQVLHDDDVARTGFALPELERRVRARSHGERTL